MPPDDRYDAGSEYHKNRAHLSGYAVRCMELAVQTLGLPMSVLDVGCGSGALVGWCRMRGLHAMGVDLCVSLTDPMWGMVHHDLRDPLDLGVSFESVCCWEVAEHLPESAAAILCDTLVRHVMKPHGRLLFTAAPPGQRGPGHIHCQPPEYWRALLAERGMQYQAEETNLLAPIWTSDVPKAPWYGRNLQCFAWA